MKLKSEIKAEIESIIPTRNFYQPVIEFPQCTRRSEEMFKKRLDAILKHCKNRGTFLIVGSSNGYNAFQLAKKNKKVVAIEASINDINFCRLLTEYYGLSVENPKFVHSHILPYLKSTDKKFTNVLMLMVFHHIMKPQALKDGLETLNILASRCKRLYVTSRDKPWMRDMDISTYRDIPRYIINNTDFHYYSEIDIPRKKEDVPNIAFGLPVWVFSKNA